MHEGMRYAVRVVDWDDTTAKAAIIAANRFGRLGHDDPDLLKGLIEELAAEGFNTDLTGFDAESLAELDEDEPEEVYSRKIEAPIYEPQMPEPPPVADLFDTTKSDSLLASIDAADLPADVAEFLRHAARRHTRFNFAHIAEFYAHAPAELQTLMEESALVIIDYDKAIEGGFVKMSKELCALTGTGGDDDAE